MRTVYDRHVYLHGSSNCGKSFILSPLKVIFQYILQSSYLLLRMDRGRGSQSDFPKWFSMGAQTYRLGRPLASAWTWCCVKKNIKPISKVFDSKTVLIFGSGPFWRNNGINRSSLMLSIVRSIASNGSLSSNFNTRSLNCSNVSLACFASVAMVFHFLPASLCEPIHHSLQEREKA